MNASGPDLRLQRITESVENDPITNIAQCASRACAKRSLHMRRTGSYESHQSN
jgi:hypothetical protein